MVKTIDIDSIASSLQGTAPCLSHSETRVWFFATFVSPDIKYLTADSAGTFRFDSIAAGKGHVGYFMDKNKNRIPDKGRIYPWHSPEPYFSATDTVEARARWDVEGVSVSICDPCGFSAIDSISADTVDSKAQ